MAVKFILRHVEATGYPPTVRDIAKAIGVSSSSTAQEVVFRLERRGWITYRHRLFRTIQVTDDGRLEASDC